MRKKLTGYCSELVVRGGDTLDFMIHGEEVIDCEVDLVRIVNGDPDPAGPGVILEEIEAPFAGRRKAVPQDKRSGSFAVLPVNNEEAEFDALSVTLAVFPTLFNGCRQTIAHLTHGKGEDILSLWLDDGGRLSCDCAGVTVALDKQMPLDHWSIIGVSVSQEHSEITLFQTVCSMGVGDLAMKASCRKRQEIDLDVPFVPDLLTLASSWDPQEKPLHSFNGKLEAPRLIAEYIDDNKCFGLVLAEQPSANEGRLLGFWDFSRDIQTPHIRNLLTGGLDGKVVNLPNRAVRGLRWSGRERNWQNAPLEYGAIHFHDTDLYDSRWDVTFSYRIPGDLRSGAYAARLRAGTETEYLTFFVSPPKLRRPDQPQIALVLPTASYLAYSNEIAHVQVLRALYGEDVPLLPEVEMFMENPTFGHSMYQGHADGSGVHYVSHLRPIWNLRPDTRPWAFPADTNIIHWLETRGFHYDVITDHDIELYGAGILNNYRVLLTGTHPEYLTGKIFDAYDGFLANGGRLMYLGGNGFYWRVAFSENWPAAMEVRRAEDGNRGWVAEPGEYYHAFDGEMGGLWRRQFRSPNTLVGIGFAAQGFTASTYFRRTQDAENQRCSFIFDGVEDNIIGDFGLRGGGAVGEEIDRFDVALGSPAHGLVLARSENHPEDMFLAKEEFLYTVPPNLDDRIRADMVFFETSAGGAVFSVGSIAWSGSLSHDNFDNSVARITENVLNRFAEDTKFEVPDWPEQEVPSFRASVASGQRINA
ncbi:N,N-dimethylformamidase beta subunit family domain-containing protein [Emcibacter nanhaiensis]|uniref:N,N-dimethylformamidase n=1 Tax=Emcibacter nanhaiensis TaxID=1505037 RepID=A0A501PGD5_9PROT|nr:N,N-dimethylformamidase beta subunit family domain-containing protein [Emcibacter nanhaiensis]TPD59255.1 N,N-dimethylformamidase [Emcibacter nanhaiensis]